MDLVDLLTEPLRSGIERHALAEVVLLGGVCGALSFWVSSFRLSYAAESLAHGLLPGLVLASLAGAPLLLGGVGGVALAAALVALASRDPRIGADSATAVVVTGMFGLGALLALSPDAPARLEELLFGDPLGVSDTDLGAAAALAIFGTGALAALHRPLCAVAFDPAGAGALGVRPGVVRLALFMFLAAAIAIAVQGLGSLLVLAVLVAPAVAVRQSAASPRGAMLSGAAVGAGCGVLGVYASHHLGS
ncbi:MAG: metal ABC transporter permease, partial [Actinobacteria bacterium]|nr:metal ABC transporter permease [Actinomycetota bacterium]